MTLWDAFYAVIGNAYGTAGLLGNLYAESGLNPRALQTEYKSRLGMTDETYTRAVDDGSYTAFVTDGAGYGLAQWTYPTRKQRLLDYAKAHGTSIGNYAMQFNFLIVELREHFPDVLQTLKMAESIQEASDTVMLRYEMPADTSDTARKRRVSFSQKFYDDNMGAVDMANYSKYINSTGTHYISNSGHDERNQYHGGEAGDQTGHEYELRPWYSRPWTVILRYPKAEVGLKIAELACAAALNNKIGYDQYQRNTFWRQLVNAAYDPAKINTACEADCTASTTAIVKAVGNLMWLPKLEAIELDTYSGNMRKRFVSAGFIALTASKYLTGYNYLQPGDVLLYEGHHAAINVTRGKYADAPIAAEVTEYKLGDRVLTNGAKGADVKELQNALIKLGYDLGKWGADGDFGDCTELAVRSFQTQKDMVADGKVGEKTLKALKDALAAREIKVSTPKHVQITGGNCYVRETPEVGNNIMGVALEGSKYEYEDKSTDGWHMILYKDRFGWVSAKYGRLVV